jgi:hypothetical protein
MRNKAVACAVAAACLGAPAGVADAQAWIGQVVGNMAAQAAAAQREEACMNGKAMPEKEVAEARIPALATMQGYFADAGAGTSFEQRFQPDKKSLWTSGEIRAGAAELGRQRDSTATGGTVLDATPLNFVRAGDGSSAMGQWVARTATGTPVASYSATFTRKIGVWRLSTLSQSPARTYVDPVVQYCHKPGDVLPYRLGTTRLLREAAEKRVAKVEARAREAAERTRAAGAPADARGRADDLQRELDKRREVLDKARAAEASAQADARTAEEEKAKALAALGG